MNQIMGYQSHPIILALAVAFAQHVPEQSAW